MSEGTPSSSTGLVLFQETEVFDALVEVARGNPESFCTALAESLSPSLSLQEQLAESPMARIMHDRFGADFETFLENIRKLEAVRELMGDDAVNVAMRKQVGDFTSAREQELRILAGVMAQPGEATNAFMSALVAVPSVLVSQGEAVDDEVVGQVLEFRRMIGEAVQTRVEDVYTQADNVFALSAVRALENNDFVIDNEKEGVELLAQQHVRYRIDDSTGRLVIKLTSRNLERFKKHFTSVANEAGFDIKFDEIVIGEIDCLGRRSSSGIYYGAGKFEVIDISIRLVAKV